MLTAIRDRATGWIAWVIVIILVIPFALWGINSYFEGGSELSVAKVNGEDISANTYQNDLQLQTQNLSQRLGANFDPQLLETLGIRERVLDNLIDNRVLSQYTDENNFRISDQQLSAFIQQQPSFQVDGKFNLQQYETVLAANRFTPQGFEQYQRINQTVTQLSDGISQTGFATERDIQLLASLQEQERKASYAVIKADRFVDEIEVTEQQIAEYYDRNSDQYQNPARVQVEYIELGVEALRETIDPTEDEIAALYEETKGRFKTAESRRASHILVSVPRTASDEEKQEKRTLVNDLLAQINAGTDFSSLAEAYSDDPGSKANGGDLGIVARDQMVKPFEDAVFSMELDEVRGPVETQFGYHLIKLTELAEEEQQPLEAVRDQVVEEAASIQAEDLFAELAESFKNLVFEDPENLTTAADELDLPIQTSEWFTEVEGAGIAELALVRNAAFSEDVLNDNLVSPAVEIGFDRLIAVKKLDYEAQHTKPLDEVRDQIISRIQSEASQAKVLELGAKMLDEIDSIAPNQTSWDTYIVDKELSSTVMPAKKQDVAAELSLFAEKVFSENVPAAGKARFGGIALANGDYALYSLESVSLADTASVDEAVLSNIRARLESRDGSEMYIQFQSLLRENAEIQIYEEQL